MTPGGATPQRISLDDHLAEWLTHGGSRIGEIVIAKTAAGGFELRHADDAQASAATLAFFNHPLAARELAKFDEAGRFRPLKSAPTLRHGWRLELPDASAAREALDYFYPAAIGNWVRFSEGAAPPVPLRDTLNRQSGIYRITALLTDEQASAVVCQTCDLKRGCLRRIAWTLDGARPVAKVPAEKCDLAHPPEIWPLVCLEACHWLVSKARASLRTGSSESATHD
jgi:sirohydrochlorin cobaltochelatase